MAAGCVLLVFLIFFGDLWIKEWVEREIPMGGEIPIGEERKLLGGTLLLRRHHNRGAILNLGQGRRSLVAALSLVLTVLMSVLFVISLGHRGNHLLRVGLALLLGGAFSNTYDRLKRKYVVDYFSFGVRWKRLRRIVFNISDFCILIGAMLSVLGAG